MQLQLKKAQRSKAYLKLGISGPSGSGKTLGALLIGYGLMKQRYPRLSDPELWEKIAIVDTENGSGELYVGRDVADVVIGEYNAITLSAPFEADKYTKAITLCEDNGIEVCILDSTTHLWSGEGGLLEQQQAATKRGGNSYTAWREITPQHNRFVEKMLQTPMHVIATMRAKQEYVQEKDSNNRTIVRKLGMEPEQRKGMEFEFTVFFDITSDHDAFGAKDRTSLFDQKSFRITPKIGQTLMQWLEGGVDTAPEVKAEYKKVDPTKALADMKVLVVDTCKELGGSGNPELMTLVREYAPSGNPNSINDINKLGELREKLEEMKTQQAVAEEQAA